MGPTASFGLSLERAGHAFEIRRCDRSYCARPDGNCSFWPSSKYEEAIAVSGARGPTAVAARSQLPRSVCYRHAR